MISAFRRSSHDVVQLAHFCGVSVLFTLYRFSKVLWTDGVATADQIQLLILLTESVVVCQTLSAVQKTDSVTPVPLRSFEPEGA